MGLQLCSGVIENPKKFLFHQQDAAAEESGKEETIFDEKRERSNEVKILSTTKAIACWNYYGKDESHTSEQKVIVPSVLGKEVSRDVTSRDSYAEAGLPMIGMESRDSQVLGDHFLGSPSRVVSISKPVGVIKEATNSRTSLDQSSTEGDAPLEMTSMEFLPSRTSSVRRPTDKELTDLGLEAYITSRREGLADTPLSLRHRRISMDLLAISMDLLTSKSSTKSSLSSESINVKKEEPAEESLKFVDNSTPRPIDQEAEQVGRSSALLTEYFVIK